MSYNRYNNNQNFYNRKRRQTDDFGNDDEPKRFRSDGGGQGPVEEELETYLFRVGELSDQNRIGGYSVESNIESTSNFVLTQINNRQADIINILLECARLPEKLTTYSTLIGLLNTKNPDFVEEFLDSLATSLKQFLNQAQFSAVHILVRFISDLVNVKVVSAKSILNIFEKMADLVHEDKSPQVRTDFYVYCILSSIPWNGRLLYEQHGPELDELLDTIKSYLENRSKDHMALLKVWSVDDPHPQEDYLDCIWWQIKKLEEHDWKESQIIRPYVSFEASFKNSTIHDFPLIVPPEYSDKILYPLPRVIFRMFDYTDVPEEFILPGHHSVERYLVEEQLHSVINTYYQDRKLCATRLLQLPITNRIPLNYMIVEIIFAQLFALPKPAHLEVFYGSLLLELCKLQPNYMPIVLAQATELLFDRLDNMKTAGIERFSSWFAYHLSNFQYKWSWEDWKDSVNESLESPKNKFLRETLVRCMRLSYHQRIVEFIPEPMSSLLPANPKPNYKYISEEAADLEGTPVANRLLELFKERAIPEDVFSALRDIPDLEKDGETEINPLKVEVFTSTLLYFGCKSFSHAFAALAKYHMIFKMLVDSEKCQLVVLEALHDVWKNHQQIIIVLVDKLLKTQIVECSSVAKWVFSDQIKNEFTSFYVWEILHSTISRMNKQVDKLRHEYNGLNEKHKKSDLDPESVQNEITEEELEQKLSTLNSLREQQKNLFFIIIERFFAILSDYLTKLELKIEDTEQGETFKSPNWFKWVSERFEDFLLTHNEEVLPYLDDIKSQFLSPNTN
ncbi:unnamed protein product, partial [Brachionus calyciflorus]